MKFQVREHLLIFITATLAPLLIYIALGVAGFLGGLKAGNAMVLVFILTSLTAYYLVTSRAIREKQGADIVVSVLYYANFLFYMIAVLVSFNLLVVAGFLYTDQVPMGLDVNPEQATTLLLVGIYILIISSLGMYYLSYSRKILKRYTT